MTYLITGARPLGGPAVDLCIEGERDDISGIGQTRAADADGAEVLAPVWNDRACSASDRGEWAKSMPMILRCRLVASLSLEGRAAGGRAAAVVWCATTVCARNLIRRLWRQSAMQTGFYLY